MRRALPVVMAAVLAVPVFVRAEAPLRVPAKAKKTASVLDRPVGELKLDKVSLGDALDFLRDSASVNMHVNWKALEAAGVTRDAQVVVRLTNVPLRKALNYVLSGQGTATWYVDEGVIEVTTQEIADQHMYTRVYPVDDLVMEIPDFVGPAFSLQAASQGSGRSGGGQSPFQDTNTNNAQQTRTPPQTKAERGQQLVDMVTQSIRPGVWKVNGGNATIAYYNGSLVITAPRQVHEMISAR